MICMFVKRLHDIYKKPFSITISRCSLNSRDIILYSCQGMVKPCRDLPININISSYTPALGQLYPGTAGTD